MTDDSETFIQQKLTISVVHCSPKYFARAIKQHFIETFGRVSKTNPSVLLEIFKKLTGDASSATNQDGKDVSERIQEVIDGEDDTLIWDLRSTVASQNNT